MKLKFSKSYNSIYKIKKDFFNENQKNYKNIQKINKKYLKQPIRKNCKICNSNLPKKIFFQHLIDYSICKKCGHLNGLNQDTNKFTDWLYNQDTGKIIAILIQEIFRKDLKKYISQKQNF